MGWWWPCAATQVRLHGALVLLLLLQRPLPLLLLCAALLLLCWSAATAGRCSPEGCSLSCPPGIEGLCGCALVAALLPGGGGALPCTHRCV